MKEHNQRMHAERWGVYQGLSEMEKKAYFIDNTPIPSPNSILSTFTRQVEKKTVFLDKSIVEVVLDDLLFTSSDDSNGEENVANTDTQLSNIGDIFELVEEENPDSNGRELYKATISNVYQYEHVIRMVGNGLSFRQTANVIQDCRDISNDSKFGCINHQKVSRLVRIFCGTALQSLKRALMCAWSFSIALDGGNKGGTPYLDVRVRFVLKATLFNVHLLAIPMYISHTGENMFQLTKRTLDVLCPGWESKIIGYTSDGASNMTGVHQGLGTRIQRVAEDGLFRIWCAAHQLDLVVQRVLNALYDEAFVQTIQQLTGHLRRQKNLIRNMKATCPRFIDSRWLSMGKLLNWLIVKRRDLQVHFDAKKPACEPSSDWWIIVFALQKVMEVCNKYMVELQGKQLLVGQQKAVLERLRERLTEIGNVQHTAAVSALVNAEDVVSCGGFSMSLVSARTFVLNLGNMYIVSLFQNLEHENPVQYEKINRSVANMFVALVQGIFVLSPECGADSRAVNTQMPPCQPHSIAKLGSFEFSSIVLKQLSRIKHTYDDHYVDGLEREFKDFEEKYASDRGFKQIVDNTADRTSTFQDNWKSFQPTYPKLVEFCGGLASVFPGTSTVESDFSVIGWEKDEYRFHLTDLSLEGILHTKQRDVLAQMDYLVDELVQ